MFKIDFKLFFISLVLLFNVPNFSFLFAQDGDTGDSQEVEPEIKSNVSPENSEEDTSELEDEDDTIESIAGSDKAEEEATKTQKENSEEKSEEKQEEKELEMTGKIGVVEEPIEEDVEKTLEQKKEKKDVQVNKESESAPESKEITQTEIVTVPKESVHDKSTEVQRANKIKPQEDSVALVKTNDVAKKLKEILKQAKTVGRNINNITDRLREIRNKLHLKYQNDVDKPLDELLQKEGFASGEAKSKDRFKLLQSAVKSEFENEWEKIKTEVNKIDSLENQVLEKLKVLDNKYGNAVQISIESRKLNLDVFNVSDTSKLEMF